jgi:non-ribosomal peptide synthetase component F/thioesterase domain-containing protein
MELEVLTTVVDTAAGDTESGQVCVFPASQEQSRYWILDRLEESTASNMAVAFRLEGAVEDSLIEPCLRELALRHEALRTTYRMIDDELSQVISEDSHFALSISDLRSLPLSQARDRAEALIREHGQIHIDLARGPVFFAHLIHVTDREHFLALTIHHIACDGWSNGILVRDFAEFYSALSQGREPSLPPLPFQFADFTVWQQEWLKTEAADAALAFWQEHIRRDMPAVDLPTDHPRSASKSGPGHIESLLLSPDLSVKLRAYSRQHDATMHQLLLAAFEGLLSRYTGQTEFLLGSTIANRTQPGMENVVGRFANPQVILADVQGDPSYRELVNRVSEWSARSYAHQDLPFSRLMEAFQLDQSGATSQFLQIYFVYQKAFMQPQQAGDLKIVPRPSVSGGVNFDLLVSVVERAEGPRLQVEYNTNLFEKDRILRLLQMYVRVLEAVMAIDTLKVSEFPLLAPSERSALDFSGRSPLPADCGTHSIPSWLDLWTSSHGNEIAIVAGGQRISWHALQSKSREFVRGLKNLGLKAGQTVAVCMEPAVDTLAAALAAMRMGAVVLPIPQGTSAAEWNLILLDLQPALSLGPQASAGRFTTLTSFEKLRKAAGGADEELPAPTAAQPAWLNVKADTGGHYRVTAVSHQATLESMLGAAWALDIRPGDAALVWRAHGSAHAWTDLLLPLAARARIVDSTGASPQRLQALLDSEQIAFAFATPGEFAALLAGGWKGDCRLHLVCRGAGSSSVANLARLAHFPGKVDVLHCSPFTAGPFAVASFLRSGEERSTGSASRLQPLGGQQLMVLDRFGSPAPFGVPGELAIRQSSHTGAGVRTGYLARSSPHNGYELIDLAERTVRLHGYRLRLGDLESFLYQNPEIATAEATLVRGSGNKSCLTAYITGHGGKLPNAQAASALLKTQAPAHLSSAEIIAVVSIPRRIDGSPDLAALPRPSVARSMPAAAAEMVAPRDELERQLVQIWEEVFGVQGIGIRNSFFSLGGYSLMIVRLFARINRVLGTSLPITTIFNAPTIEQLASLLRGNTSYSWLVPVQPAGTLPPFFLVHSYLIYDGLRSALGANRPFYGLRELESDQELAVEDRVAGYVREIRNVQPNGPYYLGGWCAAGPLAVETARQLTQLGETVAMVVLFDSWRPGYFAEYTAEQAANPQMTRSAILARKYRFHRRNLQQLSAVGKVNYFLGMGFAKVRSSRDRLFLKHWGLAHRLFTRFGMPLPHFMHNVSRNTLDLVQNYHGRPYPGCITLIRAAYAPYLPQADQACGWNTLAEGGVEVFFAPGTHESMFLEPNLSALAEILDNCFAKALR